MVDRIPRPYQYQLDSDIVAAWDAGHRNVAATLPTGGGKTFVFSNIVAREQSATCVIAHRKELVAQMALALAVNGVPHRVIGPKELVNLVVRTQHDELGHDLYNANAKCAVAGVDTLVKRQSELASWSQQVRLWVIDECHHLLRKNKWGTAVQMFPNARGLGVTATPGRADGFGLGRASDGVFDTLVEGPGMRELIEQGYLTDYTIFAPPSSLDLSNVKHASDGDYNKPQLKAAVRSSDIIGDIVGHYQRIAPGKMGLVFASDVESAADIARNFNRAGVAAEVVTGTTPASIRSEIVRRFRRGDLRVLINVDIFGEGFDLPACEVCIMARPTDSYNLFAQQFGRVLRPMEQNPDKIAIIIDHVGNVIRHGLPDKQREWTLDARAKRPAAANPDDDLPLRYCPKCTQPYERYLERCPYCNHKPVPTGRSKPEFVDGDLFELDADTLREMRGEVAKVDNWERTLRGLEQNSSQVVVNAFKKNARRRVEMQTSLRLSMECWNNIHKARGRNERESMRIFYQTFGVDTLSAKALGRPDALALADRVNEYIGHA